MKLIIETVIEWNEISSDIHKYFIGSLFTFIVYVCEYLVKH